jgi:hypothetical protein
MIPQTLSGAPSREPVAGAFISPCAGDRDPQHPTRHHPHTLNAQGSGEGAFVFDHGVSDR